MLYSTSTKILQATGCSLRNERLPSFCRVTAKRVMIHRAGAAYDVTKCSMNSWSKYPKLEAEAGSDSLMMVIKRSMGVYAKIAAFISGNIANKPPSGTTIIYLALFVERI